MMLSDYAVNRKEVRSTNIPRLAMWAVVMFLSACTNDSYLIEDATVETVMANAHELDNHYLAIYGYLYIRQSEDNTVKYYLVPDAGWSEYLLSDDEIAFLSVAMLFAKEVEFMEPGEHCDGNYMVAFGRFSFKDGRAALTIGVGDAIRSKSSNENFNCQANE